MTQPLSPLRHVQPTPGEWETRIVPIPGGGGQHVLLLILGPTGAFAQVMTPESAIEAGTNLVNSGRQAQQAGGGIVVPPLILPPGFNPNGRP